MHREHFFRCHSYLSFNKRSLTTTPDQRSTTREQVYVAGEFSAMQNVKDSLAVGGITNYFDPPTKYDEDTVMQR